ncbi:hypothetical protein B0T26DRAFT_683119 [Lasiosphaeria miniovina]|uniref:Uncharacterized protein n=1 Tax=Lasiosphaeria miniovina TaxID=1954250 RepID=A0AA40EDA6_9PEZI|nr:uncharacterized protein B0T26DRAFT_683119 [Lasiosphaeria miniovina]KAK0733206.1 hypothetical protein B0T26DRAFT_683119 [Lasiosphaeria miniovina]
MPSKLPRRQEHPMKRVDAWDDGSEYLPGDKMPPPLGGDKAPFYSPPVPEAAPKTSAYVPGYARKPPGRDDDTRPRHRHASPSSGSDGRARERRHHRENSPPQHRRTRSPSPPRRRESQRLAARDGRPNTLESRATAPPPVRDDPPSRYAARSPSPRRHRDRDPPLRRSDRHRSPPPARRRDRERDRASDGHRERSPRSDGHKRTRQRSPSLARKAAPPPSAGKNSSTATHRPTMARSKTTSAKERFAALSPRWQQAAAAAFQAGSATAMNLRSQPGAWNGEKGARIATAALGAAAIDAFVHGDKDRDVAKSSKPKESKMSSGDGGKAKDKGPDVQALSGVLGGLIVDQIAKRNAARHSKGKR